MNQNSTKLKKIMIVAVLLIFCGFTNNVISQTITWTNGVGDNGAPLTATLTLTDSVLVISGNGNMADYDVSSTGIPWYDYQTKIKTVVLKSGVTNIGNIAFQDCINLTWITIPEGVDTIGKRAFENCTSLSVIAIPSSVTTIEERAFRNCNALKAIYNMRLTPQNIVSNVFEGINFLGKYLAVSAQSIEYYQLNNVWNKFNLTTPYVLLEGNFGGNIDNPIMGADGSARYFKYKNNNPNLPEQYLIYDGTEETPTLSISFNQDGMPKRYVAADGTTFFVNGYNGNTCNGLLLTTSGNLYPVDDITFDNILNEFTHDFAQKWAEKIISKAIEKALSGQMPDATIILEVLQDAFGDAVIKAVVKNIMPDEIKYLYSCLSFAKKTSSAISSCTFAGQVSAPLFAGGPVGIAAGIVLWGNCAYNVIEMWKAGVGQNGMVNNLGDMIAGWMSNYNTCASSAKLTGGTLYIDDNGAFSCNPYSWSERKNEIKKIGIIPYIIVSS